MNVQEGVKVARAILAGMGVETEVPILFASLACNPRELAVLTVAVPFDTGAMDALVAACKDAGLVVNVNQDVRSPVERRRPKHADRSIWFRPGPDKYTVTIQTESILSGIGQPAPEGWLTLSHFEKMGSYTPATPPDGYLYAWVVSPEGAQIPALLSQGMWDGMERWP